MVGDSGIASPAGRRVSGLPPTIAPDVGPRHPRPPRRRPRRGSLERPVSGRTYRGTWLLVALPLLLAAFTVTRPAALPAPSLPAAFDEGATAARERAREALSGPDARDAPARSARPWFGDQLSPYGFTTQADRFEATVAGRGRLPIENLVAVARPLAVRDRRHGAPRQHGRRPGRERQRLGHRGADRARALVREPAQRRRPLLRRRSASARRTRSSSSRPTAARSAGSAPRTSPSTRPSRATSSR